MQGWKPQKPTKLDGNDTTTLSHHPYICHFAATYTNMLCVCQLRAEKGCGRQWGVQCILVCMEVTYVELMHTVIQYTPVSDYD